ncbi:transcription factor HBP-1b(c38)-like [Pyrus ussuriensis x Pyrus communis]|uniref:Transcription factor HBP-1b(C38)-like n=1 Tax=Pyrus ussuriensis x Pyrus communis TaxID=2448454 RepID=A0A5N5HTV7_9ROSA|nr:transcription factor HBP-1b(c38)-like [Pyrus ussuriensis x Pyrus communis]
MYQQQKGTTTSGNRQFENWDNNSAMADNNQLTDTSTDVDTNNKNHHGALMVVDSIKQAKERTTGDQKIIWALQNSLSQVYRIVYARECGGELGQLGAP